MPTLTIDFKLGTPMSEIKRQVFRLVLAEVGGNTRSAAHMLSVSRFTLIDNIGREHVKMGLPGRPRKRKDPGA